MEPSEYSVVLTRDEVLKKLQQAFREAKLLDAKNKREIERLDKELFTAWKKRVARVAKVKTREEYAALKREEGRCWHELGSTYLHKFPTDHAVGVAREIALVRASKQQKWTVSRHGKLSGLFYFMLAELEKEASELAGSGQS